MEFISSQKYKIGINEIGGALTSIIDLYDNKELIHQLDDGGWPCQDVMIFPIIGQYEYEIDNKTDKQFGLSIETPHSELEFSNIIKEENKYTFDASIETPLYSFSIKGIVLEILNDNSRSYSYKDLFKNILNLFQ